jgi:hypothetical protein
VSIFYEINLFVNSFSNSIIETEGTKICKLTFKLFSELVGFDVWDDFLKLFVSVTGDFFESIRNTFKTIGS